MNFEFKQTKRPNGMIRYDILLNGEEYAYIHSHIESPEYWFWTCNALGILREKLVERANFDTCETLCKYLKVKIDIKIQQLQNLKHFIENDKSNL